MKCVVATAELLERIDLRIDRPQGYVPPMPVAVTFALPGDHRLVPVSKEAGEDGPMEWRCVTCARRWVSPAWPDGVDSCPAT